MAGLKVRILSDQNDWFLYVFVINNQPYESALSIEIAG